MGIISFGNKKEHKNQQEKAFLEKSPYQRIEHFLHLCEEAPKFRNVNKNKGNFILKKKSGAKSEPPKDLLDIQEFNRIRNKK